MEGLRECPESAIREEGQALVGGLPQSCRETGVRTRELELKDRKESERISAYLIPSGQHVPR